MTTRSRPNSVPLRLLSILLAVLALGAGLSKIAGTELGFRVAERCMQIHGGMALATEMPISQMSRDARSFMITEGPVEVMRMVLAREIFRGQSNL